MPISHVRRRLPALLAVTLVVAVIAVPAAAQPTGAPPSDGQWSLAGAEFIGSVEFATGSMFAGTEVGGLSGIVYDKYHGEYLALSDDKSDVNDARFYSMEIDLSDGSLDAGDIAFVDVTFLTDVNGNRFEPGTLDPEGFEILKKDHLFVGSERDSNDEPWIKRFDRSGHEAATVPIPDYYYPAGDPQVEGVHLNLAFESLTVTPNGRFLYAATENALAQDGPIATADLGSPSRVIEYRLNGNKLSHVASTREFVYPVEPIPFQIDDAYADNGLVEMQAIDNFGTFLAMERSFAVGVGNTVRVFETSILGATDVSGVADIDDLAYTPMSKEMLLDLGDYGVTLDNLEGMVVGPKMADGRLPLIVVADNNFNPGQRTLFMAFAIEFDRG